jgi:lipase
LPEIRSQDIGDAEIQYLDYPGDGPTVVMLHATGFQPWLWHPIARELAGDYHVMAPYFCDHRVADPAEGGLSWLLLSDDLLKLVESLGIEWPALVGHSMGATVSSIAEARSGGFASSMVLIEPIFLPSPFYSMEITVEQHPLAAKSLRRRSQWSGEDEAREYLRSKPLFDSWDEEMLGLYLEYGMTKADNGALELACRPEREAALFMGGRAQDPWLLLERISCPVLFVEGGESENRQVVDVARAASMIPRASITVVEGAGHLVPMEKPRETLELIRGFIEAS